MAPRVAPTATASEKLRQRIRAAVASNIEQYFSGTLGTEPNVVNYVMGLIQFESGSRPGARGPYVSEVPTAKQRQGSSGARQYMSSTSVSNIVKSGDADQKRNIQSGKIAQGLMQVMGWNIVKGGSASGKCLIEETGRAELVDRLCIAAGDSIEAKILGDDNIDNNILAGLAVLETKYKACRLRKQGWSAGGAYFSTKLSCAVGAYLGIGGKDLVTGVTADSYVASIMGGDAYRRANGSSYKIAGIDTPSGGSGVSTKSAQSAASGPTTNGTGQPNIIPGC